MMQNNVLALTNPAPYRYIIGPFSGFAPSMLARRTNLRPLSEIVAQKPKTDAQSQQSAQNAPRGAARPLTRAERIAMREEVRHRWVENREKRAAIAICLDLSENQVAGLIARTGVRRGAKPMSKIRRDAIAMLARSGFAPYAIAKRLRMRVEAVEAVLGGNGPKDAPDGLTGDAGVAV